MAAFQIMPLRLALSGFSSTGLITVTVMFVVAQVGEADGGGSAALLGSAFVRLPPPLGTAAPFSGVCREIRSEPYYSAASVQLCR